MVELFEKYKNDNKIEEALLVGKNVLNKNPANEKAFTPYFDFLCFLAENLPMMEERKEFAAQAAGALAFFEENAELDDAMVNMISDCHRRLDRLESSFLSEEKEKAEKYSANIHQNNTNLLKQLRDLKAAIRTARSQEQFDKILLDINSIDRQIDKDNLTESQASLYDSLTKYFTEEISEKMRKLEREKNIQYNKAAAEAYQRAFQTFKASESTYKNQTQLFNLVSSTLFAYDASRLFNETLIYYNHIYSYIFSNLDDDGKFALTRYSIECERKLR